MSSTPKTLHFTQCCTAYKQTQHEDNKVFGVWISYACKRILVTSLGFTRLALRSCVVVMEAVPALHCVFSASVCTNSLLEVILSPLCITKYKNATFSIQEYGVRLRSASRLISDTFSSTAHARRVTGNVLTCLSSPSFPSTHTPSTLSPASCHMPGPGGMREALTLTN